MKVLEKRYNSSLGSALQNSTLQIQSIFSINCHLLSLLLHRTISMCTTHTELNHKRRNIFNFFLHIMWFFTYTKFCLFRMNFVKRIYKACPVSKYEWLFSIVSDLSLIWIFWLDDRALLLYWSILFPQCSEPTNTARNSSQNLPRRRTMLHQNNSVQHLIDQNVTRTDFNF